MSNGMDQYLANRLTQTGTFQVVTDPKRAGAVFTDRLGESFEQRLDALYPPEPPAAPKPEPARDAKKESASRDGATKGGEEKAPEKSESIEAGPPRVSSFARAPGNIFLVDVKTRSVLWSTYARPKRFTPDELARTARTIIDRLSKALSEKPGN